MCLLCVLTASVVVTTGWILYYCIFCEWGLDFISGHRFKHMCIAKYLRQKRGHTFCLLQKVISSKFQILVQHKPHQGQVSPQPSAFAFWELGLSYWHKLLNLWSHNCSLHQEHPVSSLTKSMKWQQAGMWVWRGAHHWHGEDDSQKCLAKHLGMVCWGIQLCWPQGKQQLPACKKP